MRGVLMLAIVLLAVVKATAQDLSAPGGMSSSFGPGPSATGASYQDSSGGVIGGRAGHPRIQPGRPGVRRNPALEALPLPRGRQATPGAGMAPFAFDVPSGPAEEGPADGLTLDQAIDLLTRGSLSLRAKSLEIPQARADELTASLRTNPFFFADGQLVPYRRYSTTTNPGGPTQYDINVTYPFDLSGKRGARMEVAAQARRAVEAQYQDAVRQEMDYLYTTYVDVLSARETLRFAEAGISAIQQALATQEQRQDKSEDAELQADHIEIHRDAVELAMMDAQASLMTSKRALATVLSLPREAVQRLDLRGSLRNPSPPPPSTDEMVQMAVAARPDLAVYRLNVCRALADVRLAKANRFSDVYVLYQPFTYQDNAPFNLPSSRSWALGATVTAPIYDRNQGNIRRAAVNVDQSRLEVQVIERRVMAEVEDAREEYNVSRAMVDRIENHLLPAARHVRDHSLKASQQAGNDVYAYLIAQRDYQDMVRQYRDALVRFRRATLKLNTVVGLRILP
ncbi:MAG TPA: TolC family protein [Pirellulales bacterium]|jgi:cobalt-zinc-cadmium efflux system outer membrane protein